MPTSHLVTKQHEGPSVPKFEVPTGYTLLTSAVDIELFRIVVEFRYLDGKWQKGQDTPVINLIHTTGALDKMMNQPENSALQYCVTY
jgi:hypothetical protein